MRRTLAAAVAAVSLLGAAHAAAPIDIIADGVAFAEGTIFVGETLYFVDYATSDVRRLVGERVETVWHRDGCGANGLVQTDRGLMVACYADGTVVTITRGGQTVETLRGDEAGNRFDSPNDFATDAKGGVYITASGARDGAFGKVFYRARGGRVTEVAAGLRIANGLAVSRDGARLYVAESGADTIVAFNIGADGRLDGRRTVVRLAELLGGGGRVTPDGLRLDARGRLFVALYRGGGLAVIDPDGRLITRVDLPGPHHTSLALSPDGRLLFGTIVYDDPDASRGALYRTRNPAVDAD